MIKMALIGIFFVFTASISSQQSAQESISTQVIMSLSEYVSISQDQTITMQRTISTTDSVSVLMKWSDVYRLEEQGRAIRIVQYNSDDPSQLSQSYPSYDQVKKELQNYASTYPTLCRYEVIGKSQGGRDIPKVVIFSFADSLSPHPYYWASGATHGNEEMGTVTVLELIKFLLTQYASSATAKRMVDKAQWHLVPIFNVDGYVTVRRTLNNGDDPNRSNGWQVGYKNGADASNQGVVVTPLVTTELQSYTMQFSDYPYLFGVDFHTGQVANYAPWFADHDMMPEDNNAYRAIAAFFATAGDGSLQNGGNLEKKGMPGIQTDFGYSKTGSLTMCIELCNQQGGLPSNSAQIAEKHVQAFQGIFKETQQGIMGKIVDAKTKKPVCARVQVEGQGIEVYSSPVSGYYAKYIPSIANQYTVTVHANGYKTGTVTVAVSQADSFTVANIELEPDAEAKYGAVTLECIRCYNYSSLSAARQCLGLRDGKSTQIQANGSTKAYVVLDMGKNTPIVNGNGNDFTVVCTDNGSYTVYAGSTLNDVVSSSLKKVGTGSGTQEFDVSAAGVERSRYLRIEVASGQMQLDAIEATASSNTPITNTTFQNQQGTNRLFHFTRSENHFLTVSIPAGPFSINLFSLKGSRLQTICQGSKSLPGDYTFAIPRAGTSAPGMYVVKVFTRLGAQVKTVSLQ
ncbi:MAG: hypothetical protein JW795_16650 [Chitinivibrionales bacterium]|nr:hypothetical protein [Chitinivibrionales bacterium]